MCLVEFAQNNCFVPVKVVQVEDDDSWNIAKAANYQNSVETIDLDLARFIRPQLVRKAAALAGVAIDKQETVNDILERIYRGRIAYTETRLLHIGIFSRSPNNLFAGNYTDLNDKLLVRFKANPNYEQDVFGTLFDLQIASREGLKMAETRYTDPTYVSLFGRLYREASPGYRCFISILALCSALRTNVSTRDNDLEKEYLRMSGFLEQAKLLLQNDLKIFLRYYVLSVKIWMNEVISNDMEETAIEQYMSSYAKRANFSNMFLKLNIDASADDPLQAMLQERSPDVTQQLP